MMFHPLLPDLQDLKLSDLESKISDLSKKYFVSARSGNSALCEQILIVLEAYRSEFQKRNLEANKVQVNNQIKDLDGLINVNK